MAYVGRGLHIRMIHRFAIAPLEFTDGVSVLK